MRNRKKTPFDREEMTWNGQKIIGTFISIGQPFVLVHQFAHTGKVVGKNGKGIQPMQLPIGVDDYTVITDALLEPARLDIWHLPTRKGAIAKALMHSPDGSRVLGSSCLLRKHATHQRLVITDFDGDVSVHRIATFFHQLDINTRQWETERNFFELRHLHKASTDIYQSDFDWEALLEEEQRLFWIQALELPNGLHGYVPNQMHTQAREIYELLLPTRIVNILMGAQIQPLQLVTMREDQMLAIPGIGEARLRQINIVWRKLSSVVRKVAEGRVFSPEFEKALGL